MCPETKTTPANRNGSMRDHVPNRAIMFSGMSSHWPRPVHRAASAARPTSHKWAWLASGFLTLNACLLPLLSHLS